MYSSSEACGWVWVLYDPLNLQEDEARAWLKYLRDGGWLRAIGQAPTNAARARLLSDAQAMYGSGQVQ
jgi:hypothetical protein